MLVSSVGFSYSSRANFILTPSRTPRCAAEVSRWQSGAAAGLLHAASSSAGVGDAAAAPRAHKACELRNCPRGTPLPLLYLSWPSPLPLRSSTHSLLYPASPYFSSTLPLRYPTSPLPSLSSALPLLSPASPLPHLSPALPRARIGGSTASLRNQNPVRQATIAPAIATSRQSTCDGIMPTRAPGILQPPKPHQQVCSLSNSQLLAVWGVHMEAPQASSALPPARAARSASGVRSQQLRRPPT